MLALAVDDGKPALYGVVCSLFKGCNVCISCVFVC